MMTFYRRDLTSTDYFVRPFVHMYICPFVWYDRLLAERLSLLGARVSLALFIFPYANTSYHMYINIWALDYFLCITEYEDEDWE